MTTSTLDQLVAEAQADKDNPEELADKMAKAQTQHFSVSPTYDEYAKELTELVAPLEAMLPNIAEFDVYAAPREDRIAGPGWNKERSFNEVEQQLRTKNPAYVVMTKSQRQAAAGEDVYPELTDAEYEECLDNTGLIADWWEKKPSANSLELAKSLLVHAALKNPVLHALVIEQAKRDIESLTKSCLNLTEWREEL